MANTHHNWAGLQTIEQREAALLAPYAMHSSQSAGRKYPEQSHPYRGPFQRDRDRILHSSAYRRLSHKTQVFTGVPDDYHRTRLTHTLEVACIARTLGRAVRLNEDLIEALALAHDIGHPPFGHAGEDTLDECLRDQGGFNHNRQALRVFEVLETRYPEFPGLNLSEEVLDGQRARVDKQVAPGRLQPLLEAQVVDAADGIAYNAHDADDALELGLLRLDELIEVSLWRAAAERVRRRHAALSNADLRRAIVHELIHWQVSDLVETSLSVLGPSGLVDAQAPPAIDSPAAARRLPPVFQASREVDEMKAELAAFLFEKVYRHDDVMEVRQRMQGCLREMFDRYCERPELMAEGFRGRIEREGLERTVGDYLAGMTDRFALREYRRLFPLKAQ
ncbi:MAG: deoxyguanosinetriphosphate triphosphohydrolase [Pirellulales bacterium]